ncbi:hypothetical protein UFOVP599_4 [uncultured Caudovirales phage]|jgi:hypothetical protein|uniref:Uncharacterized protein n=1 Tax=uncultured Caudovirales phage TaxID=2100421 RepID=A0A6J5MW69_9CAUD|nr:hypothetical protein UFOVP599_4 [uncultured Caudovirales phage]
MSNPGPASTQTPVYLFNGNAADGIALGVASGKIGFYGETPVVQAAAITTISDTATGTAIATAVNAIITALKNIGVTA